MEINFSHHQSAHCENGVVSNLLKHHGYDISEPMVFGIGAGLLYCYIPFLKVNHAPAITYRVMPGMIFKRFAKNTGISFKREKFRDIQTARKRLEENLHNNNPVGLQVGVYFLDYFPDEYRFHFNAHNLVVYGKEGDNYLVSDPVMETVSTLSERQMERARFAKGAFAPKGHLYYPVAFPSELHLEPGIKKGIKRVCRDMLAPVPIVGAKGIATMANLIRKWPHKKGTKVANHYLGQVIRMQEEIGTGGGGFRYIYAAFLQEASEIIGKPQLIELSGELTEIGDAWRDFALDASRIYKNRSGKTEMQGYEAIASQLDVISKKEHAFFKSLKKAL